MPANLSNIVGWSFLFLRSLFWTVLLPGTVTVYLPYRIVSGSNATVLEGWGVAHSLSVIPIVIGAAILLYCILSFAVIGRGTLSLVDAPRHLVVRGLYRYLRNPMYVGGVMILLGEALLFQSVMLVGYAAGFFLVCNLMIVFLEEPLLKRRFGESYERYCREVGRWLPGEPFDDAV